MVVDAGERNAADGKDLEQHSRHAKDLQKWRVQVAALDLSQFSNT